ncbi:sensor histidine kinase [Simiduia agarivorans]|uniref:Signal transduction histidine kinase regulating citrate/malate metabolism n=1 Tax=Simiduia agarivorans (strain DSM 21679 / JCM 13881 / BCRC 17597 / SA1) TaxID=1117647 RepID=K4KRI9_SIMAS|nr:sensor histidine kinase [Simiduia agarivorans]AFV00759.1 signal transduction histidine kinase regulating citrate/malate metabolism [Simiduia agarivorans SA1 = DSM 21679]
MNTKANISYPWLSSVSLLLALALWQLARWPVALPDGMLLQPLPDLWLWSVTSIALALVLWDLLRFHRQLRGFHKQAQHLTDQCLQLAEDKKRLQQKAHTYSNKTEKLKAFIGDKLLEYIEYDEKYLHFKGIAAEVRHNGIISYDIILDALQTARSQLPDDSRYDEALAGLGYLWDLLDLSTADNMALHINNHLCDCENYYYQQQLNTTEPAPFEPSYPAYRALVRALTPVTQSAERLQWLNKPDALECTHLDSQFRFYLDKTCQLLGNENHLVLLAENLIKNALYHKDQGLGPRPAIVLNLTAQEGKARFSVYNPGPHIEDANQQKIYQLGFTTRQDAQIHGRGLGLYFVSQIVSGYEGKIRHRNWYNQPESYSIRIETHDGLASQRVQTQVVEVVVENQQPGCRMVSDAANDDRPQIVPHQAWQFTQAIVSVEITARSQAQTWSFSDFEQETAFCQQEPTPGLPPRWQLTVTHNKQRGRLVFEPMNVNGVVFDVELPLADTEVDEELPEEEDYLSEVAQKYVPLG